MSEPVLPQPNTPGNSPHKSWFLTLNNWTPEAYDALKAWMILKGTSAVLAKEGRVPPATPHLQGIITLRVAVRFTQLTSLFEDTPIHWEVTRSTEAAKEYCRKEGDFWEFGGRQGRRQDLISASTKIKAHRTWNDVLRDQDLYLVMSSYPKWAKGVFDSKKPTPLTDLVLRPWQTASLEHLTAPPNDREISWYWDPHGGVGKSFFIKVLQRNHEAVLLSPKKRGRDNALYGYKGQSIAVFNLPRAFKEEDVDYALLEMLKDGSFFVGKYDSHQVVRSYNIHVAVFANFPPDQSKMTGDRWSNVVLIEHDDDV